MTFFRIYVRQRRKAVFIFLLFVLIFLCIFFLYDIPAAAVVYPALICSAFGVIFLLFDISAAKAKYNALMSLCRLPAALMERFPEKTTLEDAAYQQIIASVREEQMRVQTELSIKYQDMTDYYTIWAHQIKTPIASMRLTIGQEDTDTARQLSEELQRIEQYVEMVLAFVRLDSPASDYVFKECGLDGIIKEPLKKLSGQFIRKKLRLCYEPLKVKVLTDEKWLSFVIEQVLSNALKYTNAGSITIDLEEPLTLCIRDTGIGIAPEDIPRIFEKSYTGYNGRADKKASGIGLYLCRRICRNLGHTITVNSSPGSGTVVRINLAHKDLQVE